MYSVLIFHPFSTIRIAFYNGAGAFTGDHTGIHEREFYQTIANASADVRSITNQSVKLFNVSETNLTKTLNTSRYDIVIFPGGRLNFFTIIIFLFLNPKKVFLN